MRYITEIINRNDAIAVDDNILVKGVMCTAGSHILEGFVPLFSAEAVDRLRGAGYEIAGKTNIGEFGLDLLGETSYYGVCKDGDNLIGAAASLLSEGRIKAALQVDLNGSPRRAAAVSGTVFVKPTYSTVSRYGVVAACCSAEQIGVAAADIDNAVEILSVIAGHDEKDGTSDLKEKYDYSLTEDVAGKKVALIKELYTMANADVKAAIDEYAADLTKAGMTVEEVSFPLLDAACSAWQILLAAETTNNVSRFDGVKYGFRAEQYRNIDELYTNTRTEGMGFLAKATILYGSDVLATGRYDICYDKSMRVRRVVTDELKKIFKDYACILIPACSRASYEEYPLKDAFTKVYGESAFTCLASLGGMPAVVADGVQLVADAFAENTLFSIVKKTREVR